MLVDLIKFDLNTSPGIIEVKKIVLLRPLLYIQISSLKYITMKVHQDKKFGGKKTIGESTMTNKYQKKKKFKIKKIFDKKIIFKQY